MGNIPVPKDTIDLLITAIVAAGLRGDHGPATQASQTVIDHADAIGRLLWRDDANGQHYEWQPVAKVMTAAPIHTTLLQVERSRRFVFDRHSEHPDWATSSAKRILDLLGESVAHALLAWPKDAAGDPIGLNERVGPWTRAHGLTRPTPSNQRTV